MFALPVLALVGLIIYALVHYARRSTTSPEAPTAPSAPGWAGVPPSEWPTPPSAHGADLARWVDAGLITAEQSAAISAHEQARSAQPIVVVEPAAAPPRGHVPIVAEALGYLGGMLGAIGLVLVVAQYWPDMATAGRLALSGAGAVAFLLAGLAVRERAYDAFARLRWFLWLASTAMAALFAGVVTVDALETAHETTVLACGATVAATSGLLWWGRMRPVQQLTFLGGLVAVVGGLVAHVASTGPVGLAVWGIGAVYLAVGLLARRAPLPILTEAVGAVTVFVGAGMIIAAWIGPGSVFVVATALALIALGIVPGLAPTRADQLIVGVVGAVALFQTFQIPVGHYAEQAGVATGLTTWVVGGLILFIGARRLVRLPMVVEVIGGLTLIGGAAVAGAQWTGFATLFGIATAVGLVALGMLPGRVLLSILGSIGLLVNVPWAIGWFFPGEARAPLLIMVTGALIVGIAIVLARMGDRFRRDLGRLGPPPPPVPPPLREEAPEEAAPDEEARSGEAESVGAD